MIPLLILGLLRQNPNSYGYELLALMEKKHYKYIVNFTKGSFYYNLQQLEEKKFLEKIEIKQSKNSRETHNYIITELGNQEFEKLMYKYGSKTDYVNLSFYSALLFANDYKKEKLIELLETQIKQTQVRISLLDESIKNDKTNLHYFKRMLENSRSHHIVNIEWFEKLLNDIKNEN